MDTEKNIAIDFETTEVDFFDSKLKRKSNWSGHPRLAKASILSIATDTENVTFKKPCITQIPPNQRIIFHNAGFDIGVGHAEGFWNFSEFTSKNYDCTATMAKLSNNLRPAGLKNLAKSILNYETISYTEVKDNEEQFLEYAKNDSKYTKELYPALLAELKEKNMLDLYLKVEKPFILVNLECQTTGLKIDIDSLQNELQATVANIRKSKERLNDNTVNWNSPKQIQAKLFGELGLPLVFNKGKISTGKTALRKLNFNSTVLELLNLKSEEAFQKQLKSNFKFTDPATSTIYPFIHPLGTDTGRATSSNPNLQNIQKNSKLRKLFVSRPKKKLIVFDFSQIEPRVLAHFLKDGAFKNIVLEGGDFYSKMTPFLFGPTDDTKNLREIVKTLVLATLYGMSSKTLAENLKIKKLKAERLYDNFFSVFPEIAEFRESQIKSAQKNLFIAGFMNRRRYLPEINSIDDYVRSRSERQVLNSIVQGSAATIFKAKLVELRQKLPVSVSFLHHVHDEVILETDEQDAQHIFNVAKLILESPLEGFSIPLKVDGGIGNNWSEAKGGK